MKKFSTEYIKESLHDLYDAKLTDKYNSLKRGVIDLLDKTIKEPEKPASIQNFLDTYEKSPETTVIEEFVEDGDIFDFYLKYQVDVDELCKDKGWFDKPLKEYEILSLYDTITIGTKFAVTETLKLLKEEIFT